MRTYREILEWNGLDFVRFWSKVKMGQPNECWEWQAYRIKGYGQFRLGGREEGAAYLAHRVAWAMSHRDLEISLHVLHKCDNPPCVNPAHLFVGTDLDSVHDCINKGRDCRGEAKGRALKGRMPKGSAHPMSKLNEDQVRLIRRLYADGESSWKSLATMFGVSASAIQAILEGRSWSHVI